MGASDRQSADSRSMRPFFILACGRSGTTLLRSMLTCHPRIAIPRASHFIVELAEEFGEGPLGGQRLRLAIDRLAEHERVIEFGISRDAIERHIRHLLPHSPSLPTVADLCRAVFDEYAAIHGKPRWGDKTTTYGPYAALLARLFPDALFIHLLRDARDVAASLVRTEFQPSLVGAAMTWNATVRAIATVGQRLGPERYLEVRYEELVLKTRPTLERICTFLGERFETSMLDYHRRTDELLAPQERPIHEQLSRPPAADQVFKWKARMTAKDAASVEAVTRRTLARFRYELTGDPAGAAVHLARLKIGARRLAAGVARRLRRAPIPGRRLIGRGLRRMADFAHPRRWRYMIARPHEPHSIERHLDEALAWICRAQDAGSDDGVARSARLGRGRFDASYPETTGYIIPTMFDAARRLGRPEYVDRAIRMGRWESQIQMPSGAVRGGTGRWHPRPAVFNTGQVMLGWNRLLKETGDMTFRVSAVRAAEWLLSIQEPDGNWVRGHSEHAAVPAPTYNLRVAWPLAETGLLNGRSDFVEAARRYATYAFSHQHPNGWFEQCCLTDPARPLTHTLAYALHGAWELGELLDWPEARAAAQRLADALVECVRSDGWLSGRYDANWRPAVRWCCLTGNVQTAWVLWKIKRATGRQRYGDAAERLTDYVLRRHNIDDPDPTVRGGVYGSWPIYGWYGSFEVLNWATNFLIAALLEKTAAKQGTG